MVLTFDFDILS